MSNQAFLADKSSTRVRQAPGGKSSIMLGGGAPSPVKGKVRGAATPARNPLNLSPVKQGQNEKLSTRVLQGPGGRSQIKFGDDMKSPSPVKTGRSHTMMAAKTPKRNTVTGQGDFTPRDGKMTGGIATFVPAGKPLGATQASATAPFATAATAVEKPAEPVTGRTARSNASSSMSSLIAQQSGASAVTGGKQSSIRVAHAPGGRSSGNIIGW